MRTHEGYDWQYVLSGRLRLVLGAHDLVLTAGEAAEFDTRVPHWFGNAGTRAVEFLGLIVEQIELGFIPAGVEWREYLGLEPLWEAQEAAGVPQRPDPARSDRTERRCHPISSMRDYNRLQPWPQRWLQLRTRW